MPAPFPVSSTVDDFNRANGAAGGLWTPNPAGSAAPVWQVASNQLAASDIFAWMYYDLSLGASAEARFRIGTYTTGTLELELLVNAGGATWGGYAISTDGTDTFLFRYGVSSGDGGLDSVSGSFVTGDEMGLRILPGGVVEAYAKPAAGSWSLLMSATDPDPISGSFKPALYSSVAGTSIDDFAASGIAGESDSMYRIYRRRRTQE